MLKLYCKQRGIYITDFDDVDVVFDSLNEVREWLITYHSIDNDIDELNKMTLKDLTNCFDWQVELIDF